MSKWHSRRALLRTRSGSRKPDAGVSIFQIGFDDARMIPPHVPAALRLTPFIADKHTALRHHSQNKSCT